MPSNQFLSARFNTTLRSGFSQSVKVFTAALCCSVVLAACSSENNSEPPAGSLTLEGRFSTGIFDKSAAEISAYDADSQRLFVVNGDSKAIDVLSIADINNPQLVGDIDVTALGRAANSVAVFDGLVAVAIEANVKQDAGVIGFYAADTLSLLGMQTVGALPDMLTFTPDGRKVMVANEGEPNDDYSMDPEGSVSIIDLADGVASATVTTVGFTQFNDEKEALNAEGVRVFGPNATVAQDLEPEYIAVSADSKTAWVSLQENNALAIVDIEAASIEALVSLGVKKHADVGNELDASDKDDAINIQNWPVLGMYQPDAIATYAIAGETYVLTANEGDSRDYDGFSEEVRVEDLSLNPIVFAPDAAELQKRENLGRLKTTTATGDFDNDGQHDRIYSYGARSFSIRNSQGELVWDSGSDFADMLASRYPDNFNASNDKNRVDNRSDDKGIEPEAITTYSHNEQVFAYIGLERFGGVMVYEVTDPEAPVFVSYQLDRNFQIDPEDDLEGAGDLGPEGLLVIPAEDSPSGQPLLVVASEVSGTVTIYSINQ